jgi:hypothetical protein
MFPSEKKTFGAEEEGEDARVGALPTGGVGWAVESKVQRRSKLDRSGVRAEQPIARVGVLHTMVSGY